MGIKVKLAGAAQEEELEQNGTGEENDELALGDADDDWTSLLDEEDEVVDLDADAEAPSNEDAEDEQEEETDEGEGEEQTREAISDVVPEPDESDVAEPVVQEAVVVPPVVPVKTTEEQQAEFAEMRKKAEEELVNTFKLTEEQADSLIENPNEVLPQMMAKLYLDSYASIIQAVQANMPSMVQAVLAQSQTQQSAQQQFYTEWPQLNKPEYQDTLKRVADSYRVANPSASTEDFIKEVGAQGWVALRLPLDELIAHTTGKPVVKAATVVPGGRAPASPGNASQAGRTPVKKQLNEFEQMAEELLLEDD